MFQLLLLSAIVAHTACRNVEYFIQAEEIDWDYAPSGQDIINENQTNARFYLERKAYRKVVYREYTNSLFEDKAPRKEHLGILGPTIQANEGDVLIVHFRNSGSHPHSIHPTRLSYTKEYEGSMYWQVSGFQPNPDGAVPPGQTFTYHWNVSALGLPLPDVTCVSGLYYSDTDRVRDVNSGLVGFLIVCKQDHVVEPGKKNINMLLQSFDENLSWYSDSSDAQQEQNIMHSVNGFVFGNAPSLQVCIGDDVTMHFGSVGDASEPHTARIHGHSFVYMGKRQPSVPIISGLTVDAKFQAVESGNWLMTSQNPKLMKAGMQAMVTIADCGNPPIDLAVNGVIRKYYIAIDSVMFPGRSDAVVSFVPYVDSRFTTKVMRTRDNDYLGVLGPLLQAEIGDTIKIVVKNNDTRSHSLQPHGGVRVHKYNEGAFYNDTIDTAPIHPGHLKTYYWTVSELTGPTAYNLPCMPSFYTSGVDVISEVHAGLIGPMLICQSGLLENMIPGMRDIFLFYIRSNGVENNEIHGLNGFPPNAFPRIEISLGDNAVLHAMDIGTDDTASSLFADGIPFSLGGSSIFTLGLHHGLIQSTKLLGTLEGQWKIENTAGKELSFDFRIGSGLEARGPLMTNVNETFYIAIVTEYFDYTDRMYDELDWRSQQNGVYKTGPEFMKTMFKCYKRSDFFWSCIKKAKGQRPPLRVVVGTNIKIVFRNNGNRNYSMYSPGVMIRRLDGGTRLTVSPGEKVDFIWTIPESIGPGSGDQDCVMRRYYSNVDPERDVASGLIGPLIICRDHAAVIIDEAVNMPLLVGVVNEARSWYIDDNIPAEYASINRSDPSFIKNNRITVVDYRAAMQEQLREGYINQDFGYYLHNIGDAFHSIHFRGCIISASSDVDLIGQNVVPLFPAETKHVIFTCREPGSWKFEGMRYQDKIQNHELFGVNGLNQEPTGGIS